jgi:hypothetical protein
VNIIANFTSRNFHIEKFSSQDFFGKGKFLQEHEECHATHFNMIAGGTGINPVSRCGDFKK